MGRTAMRPGKNLKPNEQQPSLIQQPIRSQIQKPSKAGLCHPHDKSMATNETPIHQRMYLHPISMDGHHDSSPLGIVLDEQQIDCSAPTPSRPNFGSKIGRKSQRGVAHPSISSCPPMAIKGTHPDINDHQKVQQASRQNQGRTHSSKQIPGRR
ncbi:hypothetical protein ACLOJK_019272 [Asimina triloba]